jgi:hypothetical protein
MASRDTVLLPDISSADPGSHAHPARRYRLVTRLR